MHNNDWTRKDGGADPITGRPPVPAQPAPAKPPVNAAVQRALNHLAIRYELVLYQRPNDIESMRIRSAVLMELEAVREILYGQLRGAV